MEHRRVNGEFPRVLTKAATSRSVAGVLCTGQIPGATPDPLHQHLLQVRTKWSHFILAVQVMLMDIRIEQQLCGRLVQGRA